MVVNDHDRCRRVVDGILGGDLFNRHSTQQEAACDVIKLNVIDLKRVDRCVDANWSPRQRLGGKLEQGFANRPF